MKIEICKLEIPLPQSPEESWFGAHVDFYQDVDDSSILIVETNLFDRIWAIVKWLLCCCSDYETLLTDRHVVLLTSEKAQALHSSAQKAVHAGNDILQTQPSELPQASNTAHTTTSAANEAVQPIQDGGSFIGLLPMDVNRIIFALARTSLPELARVCKKWKQVAYDGQLHALIAPALSLRCGEAVWKKYIGDPGKEAPLPLCIFRDDQFDELCQDLVKGTGWLTLVPKKVKVTDKKGAEKEVLINAENMGDLVKTPKEGCPTRFDNLAWDLAIKENRPDQRPAHKMHWVWIRSEPIGRSEPYSIQQKLAQAKSRINRNDADVSGFLDTIVTMFMEKIRTGNNCLDSDRIQGERTWIRVKEQSNYCITIVSFAATGLNVLSPFDYAYKGISFYGLSDFARNRVVVAVARKSIGH